MPNETLSLSKSSLAFAKLSATPTEKAWSQAYNAGNLFACLSLNAESGEELHALQTLGKDLFSNLEAEFFTLEEKNLTTIAEAIKKSTKHIPATIAVNFCLAYFKDAALYLFLLGGGRVIMKREDKMGILLDAADDAGQELKTASGYLQNDDIVILETNQFAHNVSDTHLTESLQLNLPSDIAESLSLHMHKNPDGDQAAIIVVYHGVPSQPILTRPANEEDETLEDLQRENETVSQSKEPFSLHLPSLPKFSFLPAFRLLHLNHRKRFFLSITVVIFAILLISIFMTKQKQETSKNSELFTSIYTPAQSSYEEGKGLENLNKTLSREDYQKAEKILLEGKDTFPQGSKEDTQIEALLAKVQAALGPAETNKTTAKETSVDENSLLSIEKANTDGSGFGQNEDATFFATSKAAFSVSKSSGTKKELVKNDATWDKALSVVPFQANFYLLDSKNGVLKFVPAGSTYNKNDYFTDQPDLSKATSMAIDGAIWILASDGSITKYLKGEKQSFSVKGLTKPFSSPTKLVTDADTESLYVLDSGNSRIVSLGKDGAFQKEYSASILKGAKDFEVLEKDKKLHILSGDKVWEIELK